MALTNKQIEAALDLFVASFINQTQENERKKIYFVFEDAFGKGIPDWQNLCRGLMQNKCVDDKILKYYDEIVNRGEISHEKVVFEIRMFQERDLPQVRELINKNFNMGLTSFDDERFEKFIDSGYSVVACNDDEIFGVALAYEVPDYNIDTVYLDTFVVAEAMRGCGIGKNMIKHIKGFAKADSGSKKIKLQTDRKFEAYSIYKHWGFVEDDLAHMYCYYL